MNHERRVVALLRDLVAGGRYPRHAESLLFSDICEVSSRYALLPWSLNRLSASDVPDAIRLPAAAAAHLELIRGTLLLHDLRDVVGWLAQAGIRSIPIKGAALLAMTPDASGWRHTEDIDLLVEPGMVHAAEKLLQERNLPLVHPTGALLVDGTPAEFGYVSDMHHVYPRRLPRGTPVELHSRPPESDLRWDELWAHAVEAAIGVRVPSPQHQLEILSRHVFRHHYGQVPMVARHCVDVKAILETSPLERPMSPDVQFSL
ncbi:MAG: nucleotidyltransferase family protein, partial [Myxococcales bacterium]|nr:nucleotidyltransferase family protein [Myxococcales bacterium]